MFQVNSARNIEHLSMNRQKKIDRNIFLKVFLTRSRQSPLYDFKNTGNRPALLLNKGENVAPDYIRVLYICTVQYCISKLATDGGISESFLGRSRKSLTGIVKLGA